MKIKFISFLLTFTMLLALLAACAPEEPVDNVEDPDNVQQEDVQGDETKEEVPNVLNIVVDGVSEYVIVRGENASPSEVTAANELQSYLKK